MVRVAIMNVPVCVGNVDAPTLPFGPKAYMKAGPLVDRVVLFAIFFGLVFSCFLGMTTLRLGTFVLPKYR